MIDNETINVRYWAYKEYESKWSPNDYISNIKNTKLLLSEKQTTAYNIITSPGVHNVSMNRREGKTTTLLMAALDMVASGKEVVIFTTGSNHTRVTSSMLDDMLTKYDLHNITKAGSYSNYIVYRIQNNPGSVVIRSYNPMTLRGRHLDCIFYDEVRPDNTHLSEIAYIMTSRSNPVMAFINSEYSNVDILGIEKHDLR